MFEDPLAFDWGLEAFFAEGHGWQPEMDIAETDTACVLQADMPDIDPRQIEVTVKHDLLTITVQEKREQNETVKPSRRGERRHGSFYCELPLPRGIDVDTVSASFENGVLTVTMPKTENERPRVVEVFVKTKSRSS